MSASTSILASLVASNSRIHVFPPDPSQLSGAAVFGPEARDLVPHPRRDEEVLVQVGEGSRGRGRVLRKRGRGETVRERRSEERRRVE